MKKKLMILLLGVVVGVAGFTATASAADFVDGWVGCTPLAVGPDTGDVMIKLGSCGDGRTGWAMLSTTGADQMMASLLTAMSLGKPVSVLVSGTANSARDGYQYSKVTAVQLSME